MSHARARNTRLGLKQSSVMICTTFRLKSSTVLRFWCSPPVDGASCPSSCERPAMHVQICACSQGRRSVRKIDRHHMGNIQKWLLSRKKVCCAVAKKSAAHLLPCTDECTCLVCGFVLAIHSFLIAAPRFSSSCCIGTCSTRELFRSQ